MCVDETLFGFLGHSAYRQYMPNKPAKYGLKYNNLVCCASSYLLDSLPYLGKQMRMTLKLKI